MAAALLLYLSKEPPTTTVGQASNRVVGRDGIRRNGNENERKGKREGVGKAKTDEASNKKQNSSVTLDITAAQIFSYA